MATVSTATAEKLDGDDDEDETAGWVDEQLRDEESHLYGPNCDLWPRSSEIM